ncbi:MAG: TIGR03619 family F420-dependent LLM class oxidoreductase [Sphingomonadales bacterium]|nr:TIGR03619 family F420-dependent LLM class oxidoreductase [Sphingomonadales bacterium]
MKINIPLPFDIIEPADEFTTMAAVREIGAAVERAGFHSGLVTDHPCPTGRWLDSGGHYAQGPFVMLALLAACTTRLRLQTGILVLPYRNPFGVARDIATLDRFSGGRVTLSVGAGYLKGEYRAMGVNFDARNELMDEYIRALRVSLTGEEFTFEGDGYVAYGNRIQPGPVQSRVPILVGGNARRAIRRAVDLCDGWNPFFTGRSGDDAGVNTQTTRTLPLTGPDDLRAAIDYMREYAQGVGKPVPEVVLGGLNSPGEVLSSQQLLDRASIYREMGVQTGAVSARGRTRAEWCDDVERIGAEVIARLDA